ADEGLLQLRVDLKVDESGAETDGLEDLVVIDRQADGRFLVAVDDRGDLARFPQTPGDRGSKSGSRLRLEFQRLGHDSSSYQTTQNTVALYRCSVSRPYRKVLLFGNLMLSGRVPTRKNHNPASFRMPTKSSSLRLAPPTS